MASMGPHGRRTAPTQPDVLAAAAAAVITGLHRRTVDRAGQVAVDLAVADHASAREVDPEPPVAADLGVDHAEGQACGDDAVAGIARNNRPLDEPLVHDDALGAVGGGCAVHD